MASVSLREFFGRRGLTDEAVSLRRSLATHPEARGLSVRTACARLVTIADGDGYSRGCRREGSITIDYAVGEKKLGGALPNWVAVTGRTRVSKVDNENRITPDFAGETRTVEGVLLASHISGDDFPFEPWHTYYDWNFIVQVDNQYRYLLSRPHLEPGAGGFECEWDSSAFPIWAWPQDGDRVWIVGRWIYDCGHPDAHGHRTEIHPPKAVVSFRSGSARLPDNSGPTRVTEAVVFIGRDGGYWRQPINDQDYAFDVHLPPRPGPAAEPSWAVVAKTGKLAVEPVITPFPADLPRALRVVIPLKGVNPHPESYGAVVSAGWSDPHGTETRKVKRFRVTVEKIFMDANLDPRTVVDPAGKDEWYLYVGINGRWKVFESMHGDAQALDYAVTLDLHQDDKIHITACGFEADEIHDLMAHKTGLSWADVCSQADGLANAKKIRSGFLSLGFSLDPGIENEKISIVSQYEPASPRGATRVAPKKDYRLQYKIEAL